MENKKSFELRMYGLVPYNISEIQKGIQYGHAVVEYGLHNFKEQNYQDWANNWKTFIILNGGTSNDGIVTNYGSLDNAGSMQYHLRELRANEINVTVFREPDLNGMLSSIVFLVDERVFNKEDYPDFKNYLISKISQDNSIYVSSYDILKDKFPILHFEWLTLIGGKKNAFLKEFLKPFKFA